MKKAYLLLVLPCLCACTLNISESISSKEHFSYDSNTAISENNPDILSEEETSTYREGEFDEEGFMYSYSWPNDAISSVLPLETEIPVYKNFGILKYKKDMDGTRDCVIIKIENGSDKTYKGYLKDSDMFRVYEKGEDGYPGYYTADDNEEIIWMKFGTFDNELIIYVESFN